MEELRPLVEQAFATVLGFLAEEGIRSELRAMSADAERRVAKSEALVEEANALMAKAEEALASR